MTPFLKLVADDLLRKIGTDLSRTVLVFPNRRAGLFLNEYLAQGIPVWAPRYQSITELFASFSPFSLADSIGSVCRIHRIYARLTGSNESLDSFYGWGERLLADFDDVDKNLADPESLFINVRDYNNLDYTFEEAFTEEQRHALRRFLVDLHDTDTSRLRQRFYALWGNMLPIYNTLNAELAAEGLAYEGALYRNVVQQLSDGTLQLPDNADTYVFVGFNVLDAVEHRLFSLLRDAGKARFYWDYDVAYCETDGGMPSEAGLFLKDNLQTFGNELPPSVFNNLLDGKDITFVAAPTENAQAFSVAPWLSHTLQEYGGDPRRTAVVLCNEDLVEPVLHAIPEQVSKLNFTKGFPLSHTPAYTLIARELALTSTSKKKTNEELLELLAERVHTEAEKADMRLQPTANTQLPENAPWLRLLYIESYYQTYTLLERFRALVSENLLTVEPTTLRRLLLQVLRKATVPFHGDPVEGIQIMGVLETRNLDFDNLLLLSVNEGKMPHPPGTNSFIPYPLRKAYGLTDIEKQGAVYAYYFYRLIQRARHIRMMYNCTSSKSHMAEMSRFMRQMLLSGRFEITSLTLSAPQDAIKEQPITADKPQGLLSLLNPPADDLPHGVRPLSPSALNKYLDCPLKFYFSRLHRLQIPDPATDDIQNKTFGDLFHKAAELLYQDVADATGRVSPSVLKKFLDGADPFHQLSLYVERAFTELRIPRNEVAAITAEEYLRNLVRYDARQHELQIIALERTFSIALQVRLSDHQTGTIHVGGCIDRLDCITDPQTGRRIVRVVDYKTGEKVEDASSMAKVFTPAEKRPKHLLQTFLYALAVREQLPQLGFADADVACALFYPHQATGSDYEPYISFKKQPVRAFNDEMAEEFRLMLTEHIEQLLDEQTPFRQCENETGCKNCDYRSLCGKAEGKE